jgi:hypothetical protein
VDAFKACGEKFAELFEASHEFATTEEALQSAWWTSRGRDGVHAQHVLDPTTVNFEALLGILYRATLKRHGIGYRVLDSVFDLVPKLGRDSTLELGGQGVRPLGRF